MVLCVASLKLHRLRFLCYWTYLHYILVHLLPALEKGRSLVNVCKLLYTHRLFLEIWLLNCLFVIYFLNIRLIKNKTSEHDEVKKDLSKDAAKDWLLNGGNAERRRQRQDELPVWMKYWKYLKCYFICSHWHMSKVYSSEWMAISTFFLIPITYYFNCSINLLYNLCYLPLRSLLKLWFH